MKRPAAPHVSPVRPNNAQQTVCVSYHVVIFYRRASRRDTLNRGTSLIVAMIAEKGGTGKTTLATSLAGMRAASGGRVLLVDADRQGSSHFWAQTRSSLRLPRVDSVPLYGEAFARQIATLSSRYDDVVIDTGAGDSAEMETALRIADCAVAPLQPAGVDVWTMGLVDGRVAAALERNPDLRAWALFNRASANPRSRDEDEARAALEGCAGLKVADTRICDRVAFRRALTVGMTVHEYRESPGRAREEMAAVYELAFGESYAHRGITQHMMDI